MQQGLALTPSYNGGSQGLAALLHKFRDQLSGAKLSVWLRRRDRHMRLAMPLPRSNGAASSWKDTAHFAAPRSIALPSH